MVEGDLGLGLLNLGEERHEWLDQVEEAYCEEEAHMLAVYPEAVKARDAMLEAVRRLEGCRGARGQQRAKTVWEAGSNLRLLMMGNCCLQLNSSRGSCKIKEEREGEQQTARFGGNWNVERDVEGKLLGWEKDRLSYSKGQS